MRQLTVTKEDFDNFIYTSVSSQGSANELELLVAARLLTKLCDSDLTELEVISSSILEQAKALRQKLIPSRLLKTATATFFLEEDEYELLLSRIIASIPNFSNAVAIELSALISNLRAVSVMKMSYVEQNSSHT